MRADSVDIVFSAVAIDAAEDWARVFRQVQRVLKPNAPFVFSHAHPFAACVDGDRVVRAYQDPGPVTTTRWGETVTIHPRGLGNIFIDLSRAGFRIDALHEPRTAPAANVPSLVVWRARKEGS